MDLGFLSNGEHFSSLEILKILTYLLKPLIKLSYGLCDRKTTEHLPNQITSSIPPEKDQYLSFSSPATMVKTGENSAAREKNNKSNRGRLSGGRSSGERSAAGGSQDDGKSNRGRSSGGRWSGERSAAGRRGWGSHR
ncbi:GQ67_00031T0 [Komagataella phaffii]|nr:GQ67_00031T0 [Komagataella phaffii]AOA67658.1 GQ68_01356T0 [Komagataella phaffii GS115]